MTTKTITDPAEFRAGDTIRGEFRTDAGDLLPFEAVAWRLDPSGPLCVLGEVLRSRDGSTPGRYRNLTATRPILTPPQEVGALILAVTAKGGRASAGLVRLAAGGRDSWKAIASGSWFSDDDLISWTTTTITPGESVTR